MDHQPSIDGPPPTLDYATVRPSHSSRWALYAAAVVVLVFAVSEADFAVSHLDYCGLTDSMRVRKTTFLVFDSVQLQPSPLETEAVRRGIPLQHSWRQVSESRRSLSMRSIACSNYTKKCDARPSELAAMSNAEIQAILAAAPLPY